MHRCRECHVPLQEGRNWHASYAARTYRHCMDCAKAYSRKRYERLRPGAVKRAPKTKRDWAVKNRAEIARQRRARTEE
ncbi:MAG: hypothetical protein EOO78_30560 [Oxalobacteraceae bacterium]|nr:MAG: hypothetical protein EOO78_30560 [Oxalobacteraceae bacterium]